MGLSGSQSYFLVMKGLHEKILLSKVGHNVVIKSGVGCQLVAPMELIVAVGALILRMILLGEEKGVEWLECTANIFPEISVPHRFNSCFFRVRLVTPQIP